MKKILILATILTLSLALVSCGNSDSSQKQDGKTGLEILKNEQKSISDFSGIPDWAKDLGAVEPEGLILDKSKSSVTVENPEKHLNENFTAHYYGEPDKLMSEAKKIVKALNGTIKNETDSYLIAGGDLPGNHVLSLSVRTSVKKPYLHYTILGRKKFNSK